MEEVWRMDVQFGANTGLIFLEYTADFNLVIDQLLLPSLEKNLKSARRFSLSRASTGNAFLRTLFYEFSAIRLLNAGQMKEALILLQDVLRLRI